MPTSSPTCSFQASGRRPPSDCLLKADPQWAAPRLWRSELRNVLSTYVRAGSIELSDAIALFERALLMIGAEEYEPEAGDVLRLSKASGASADDCEYAALAEYLGAPLVTADKKLLKAFPGRAVPLSRAAT